MPRDIALTLDPRQSVLRGSLYRILAEVSSQGAGGARPGAGCRLWAR